MHGRYWVHVIAVGLLIVSGWALPAQEIRQPILKDQPVTEAGQQKSAQDSQKDAAAKEQHATDTLAAIKGIEAALREHIAKEDKADSERKEKREVEDLEAQKDMARWAKYMFIAAVASLILTTVGVGLILWNLIYARDLAKTSTEMADQAKLSTKAAIDAAEATTSSANFMLQIELPIPVVIHMVMEGTGKPVADDKGYPTWNVQVPGRYNVVPRVHVKNFGKTPAFPYEIALGHKVARTLVGQPEYIKSISFRATDVVKPEPQADPFRAEVRFGINLSVEEVAKLEDKEAFLWLFGAFRFRDFMGEGHEACFCWRWAQRPDGEGSYYFAADGDPPPDFVRRRWLTGGPKRQ